MKTLFIFLILFISGCNKEPNSQKLQQRAEEIVNDFIYVKDSKGICYATAYLERNIMVLTTVPCEKAGL